MKFREQKAKLRNIYDRFEDEVGEYKANAVCELGCSFCCTKMGNVDIVTLEGIIIRKHISSLPDPERSRIGRRIAGNRKEKESGVTAPCPFQDDCGACLIYDIRPFSCRQLYSLRKCDDDNGSLVHKPAVEKARKTVRRIQQLDWTGYSGHLSYILFLLENRSFRELYTSGGFDSGRIKKYGETHGIIINRFAK